MKIFIIGSGNVATQLGLAFFKAGHNICGVYSRNFSQAKKLEKKLKSKAIASVAEIKDADVILIAVADDAINEVIKLLKAKAATVVHTSGSVEAGIFKNRFKNYGVFYPVQTIKKNQKLSFKNVPVCIEGNNEKTQQLLMQLAGSIETKIFVLDSAQRRNLHLAAVFANNFANHLFVIAEKILLENNLPYEILIHLIKTTAQNAMKFSPKNSQTGPAKRGDKKVLEKHLQLLRKYPEWKKIYEDISKNISRE